jgi:H/ACA ribonucleoprotein complex subunit 3
MRHILKCPDCGSYGISIDCACGGRRLEPKPAKFSPEDKYGHYRREAKKIEQEKLDTTN